MLSRIHSSDTFIATANSLHKYLLDCSWWKITYSRQLTLLVICQGQSLLWKTNERDDVANIGEVNHYKEKIWIESNHYFCNKPGHCNLAELSSFTVHKDCQSVTFYFYRAQILSICPDLFRKTNKEIFKPMFYALFWNLYSIFGPCNML